MVVAADEIVRVGVRRVLRRAGFRTAVAQDADQALERARSRHAPHLILADVETAKMGGLTLAERAREANPDVRVLLMTRVQEDSGAEALQKQGVFWIEKPTSAEALVEAVRSALAGVTVSRS
jgi:two-component system chemotaxis response regulator CheY